MSERSLRDELEQLQSRARALEAEQALEHSPLFLSRRDQASAQLTSSVAAVGELERKFLVSAEEAAALGGRVQRLSFDLAALEQKQLPVWHYLVVPLAVVAATVLLQEHLSWGAAGFCCALGLGILFGPRLIDWSQLGRERAPLVPNLLSSLQDTRRNPSLGPMLFALACCPRSRSR